MIRLRLLTLATFAVLGSAAVLSADDGQERDDSNRDRGGEKGTILEFETMAAVPRPYTGSVNAVRGVPGGGLPWMVSSAKGELDADGHLVVKVTGLVLSASDPAVIQAGLAGQNPVGSFASVVSCLSKDMAGAPSTVNLMTQTFPATTGPASAGGGNARIEAYLQLPKPCIAPIIFVTSPTGAWFAATGF